MNNSLLRSSGILIILSTVTFTFIPLILVLFSISSIIALIAESYTTFLPIYLEECYDFLVGDLDCLSIIFDLNLSFTVISSNLF